MKTSAKRRGFTLIELLAVIAIIGVLATLIVPVTGKIRENARQAKCASNVRQIGLALITAANQNKDQAFPENNNSGAWAWDVSHSTVKELVNQAGREVLYCPSSPMVAEYGQESLFMYPMGNPSATYAVTSYVLLIKGTKQIWNGWTPNNPIQDYLNERIQATYNTENQVIPASRRPLVVDEMISGSPSLYSFENISGALPHSQSNHMAGKLPTGGHVAFVDGHVTWRKFRPATSISQINDLDYFAIRSAGANPKFWF